MKHLGRWLLGAGSIAVAAAPAIVADPSFAHYVATHPWAAAYLPLVTGVVVAVAHAVKDRKQASSTPAGP